MMECLSLAERVIDVEDLPRGLMLVNRSCGSRNEIRKYTNL